MHSQLEPYKHNSKIISKKFCICQDGYMLQYYHFFGHSISPLQVGVLGTVHLWFKYV
jgi:hypothetical protein